MILRYQTSNIHAEITAKKTGMFVKLVVYNFNLDRNKLQAWRYNTLDNVTLNLYIAKARFYFLWGLFWRQNRRIFYFFIIYEVEIIWDWLLVSDKNYAWNKNTFFCLPWNSFKTYQFSTRPIHKTTLVYLEKISDGNIYVRVV